MKPSYFFFTVTFLFAVLDIAGAAADLCASWAAAESEVFAGDSVDLVGGGDWVLHRVAFLESDAGGHVMIRSSRPIVAGEYIWHFLLLPILALGLLIDLLIRLVRGGWRRLWLSTEPTTLPSSTESRFITASISHGGGFRGGAGGDGGFVRHGDVADWEVPVEVLRFDHRLPAGGAG